MFNFGSEHVPTSLPVVIGDSPAMLDAVAMARRVADTTAGILIEGETGTGKELLARLLHSRSRRRYRPFVTVDCAALAAAGSLEHELFGDETPGKLEEATGGTLFLDEVGDMDGAVQARLLRTVEERAVEQLDGEPPVPIDLRIVGATTRPLRDDVASGRFRQDLYYRLVVVVLTLPPLRERGDDVRMLAEHFVGGFVYSNDRYALGLAGATLSLLAAHPWPGNVRQLKEILEQAASGADGPLLLPTHFPAEERGRPAPLTRQIDDGEMLSLDELERRHVQGALSMTGGHLKQTAQILGIDQFALRRRLQRYEMVRSLAGPE